MTWVRVRYASGGIFVAAITAGLLLLPAGAAGQGGPVNSLAAQQCAQERATIGKKAFRKKYGAKKTMKSCMKRTRPQVAAVLPSANTDCQAELAEIGADEFIFEYGEDETSTLDDAMTECIAEDVDAILNPDTGDDSTDDGTDDGTV
jgi:hypothetical protein